MAHADTRTALDAFSAAVTSLEHALDTRAPVKEIMERDREVADRTREIINLVEMLRSRRIR